MHQSLWENVSWKNPNKEEFCKKTDVLIIGGGITGLSTAYFLKDTNKKVTVIDKGQMMMGITARTTAKVTFLQGIYEKLRKERGSGVSHSYYASQKDAIHLLTTIIEKEKITCDLEKVPSVLFAIEEKTQEEVKKEEALLKSWGEKTREVKHENIAYGFSVSETYTFHPLKYLKGLLEILSKKTHLLENVLAFQIEKKEDGYQIYTSKGVIEASYVVVACHYPFYILPSLVPLKTYLKREYVNASKIPKQLFSSIFTAINLDKDLHSIRFYKDYLLYGSNQHLLTDLSKYENAFSKSQQDFRTYFQKKPEITWLNQDIYSYDHLPLIGKVRKEDNHLLVATAYSAFGMTNGTLAGKMISDLIIKGESPYEKLFSPTRKSITYYLRSIIGSSAYLKTYVQPIFAKNKVSKVKLDGIVYNLYIDETGEKHFILDKCPHFKCPLLFNEEEKTWDCPCHGSRFDLDGNLLYGPSKQFNGKEQED